MSIITGRRIWKRRFDPCTGATTEEYWDTWQVGAKEVLKLPPEHRVKPAPLDVTPRALQYTMEADCLILCKHKHMSWCYTESSGWQPVYEDEFAYGATIIAQPTGLIYDEGWIQAMRLKLQEDKVSFADTIGEWRESVKLLGSSVSTLTRAFALAKKILRRRANRRDLSKWFRTQFGRGPTSKLELMDAVSLDLAIKFGIKPNLNLLWDTLAAAGRVKPRIRRLQVTVKDKAKKSYPGPTGSLRIEGTRSVRAIAFVRYDVGSSEFTRGNLGESLWAGIPVSFVIDWFFDVGSYLSSFNAMNGVESFTCVKCIREEVKQIDDRILWNGAELIQPCTAKYKSFERQVIGSLPFSDPPSLKLPDSELWERLWTLTEILGSLRRR